jgi:pimeloyl-ACP methyl ester carboxylesterase
MSTHRHSTSTRRGVLAALAVAVLALGMAACGVGPTTAKDKIAKTTSTYLRALADGDTAVACHQLSRHAQGDHCPQALKRRRSQLTPDTIKHAADASLGITLHGNTATATLGQPHGAHLTLVKLGSDWRIDSGFTVPEATSAPPVAAISGDTGRLVDVGGGRRLYVKCVGSGRPTVVLEAGFPGSSDAWRDVQPQLGHTTRTCAYDRAGLGKSPRMPGVHDAGDEINDEHRLLRATHLPGPYVLVGHSYGGMLVRLFAHRHPAETAGIVLVDARGIQATRRQLAIWPKTEAPAVRREAFRPLQQGVNLAKSETLVSRVRSLGHTPLAVVTAGRHDQDWDSVVPRHLARALDRLWTTMQDELAALSTNEVHVVALRSDHFVQRVDGQPDVVIRAVRAVVGAAREHTRLPSCDRLFTEPGVRCRR